MHYKNEYKSDIIFEKRKKEKEAQKRREESKRKRKQFFKTLWSIITFPFKILFFPVVIWKRSSFFGILASVGYLALICFFFRYATPTYYGTEFYLGNKLGYTHYKVADGVTTIAEEAFKNASGMKTVELPDSLQTIESGAFRDCSSLEEITFPVSVTSFGNWAFERCQSLEKVTINAPSFELAGSVFAYCVSLTDIETVGELTEDVLRANTNGCRNLEREEMMSHGCGYGAVPKDFPLLENEVQLKNAMDTGYIHNGNSIVTVFFDPKTDKLANIQIGEEQKTEDGRCVSVTFSLQKDFIEQDFAGTLTTTSSWDGWESVSKNFELMEQHFLVDKVESMQQQFAEGNYSELEAMLGKYDFMVGEEAIPFGEGQVTVEQAQVVPLFTEEVNEAGETVLPENPAYRIAIKAFVDKNLNDYTFMGNILLSEKHSYVPQVITNMSEWNGMNLLGTYEYTNEDGVHQFTIDSQYDNIYTVTGNSRHSNVTYIKEEAAVDQKRLLVLNDDGKSGKMVSANNVGDYSVWDVEINAYKDGLELKSTGSLYKKVSDEVTPPDEEFNNPLVGVWEGVYDTSRSHVASRRYIFPAGGENLTVISKFGPTAQTPDFQSGATVDVLLWNEEYNSGIIESRAWVHQPQGYNFVIFEGNLDESGTTISGGGEYPFTMTKTEAYNESYSYGTNNGAGWSIYDGNGNPWPTLFAISDDIPTDALQFGESYYKFYSNASSWEEVQQNCVERGGHLAIIDSAEENAFLHSYFLKYGYERCYFGLSDVAEEGNWTWIDGTSAKNRYSNWNKNEPNGDSVYEDYGEFWNKYTDGTWNDCQFYESAGYICEWDGLVFGSAE